MLTVPRALTALALLSLFPAPCAAQTAPRLGAPGTEMAGLTVVTDPASPSRFANDGVVDFGPRNALDRPEAEAAFVLKNTGLEAVTVVRFQPSCHCTTARFTDAAPAPDGSLTIPAGRTARVAVRVDLRGQPAGPLDKTVMVFVAGSPRPAAELEVTGSVAPLVSVLPSVVEVGAGQPVTVTVTVDRRVAPSGSLPALISSSPSVRVAPQPVVVASNAPVPAVLVRRYVVSLRPDAPLGPISGSLSFAMPNGTAAEGASAQAFRGASALLLGDKRGEVWTLPESLSFGLVHGGESSVRLVALQAHSARTLADLRITSSSPWITASLQPPVGTARGLTVTLAPGTPPGSLRASLKVMLGSGSTLIIPVTASVQNSTGL